MEKVNKRYWILGIVFTLVLAVTATTYAYWRGVVSGEGANMSFNLDEVYVVFTDNTPLGSNNVKPGWGTSKTFTLENQSNRDYYYNILIKDLINTFVLENGLQYKITSTSGYNMEGY